MYLFGLRTGLAKTVGIGSPRIPAAVLFLSLCSASLKDLQVSTCSSLWDPFYINRQKIKFKSFGEVFPIQKRRVEKFGVRTSESFLHRSLKILGRARPYSKFGEFFSLHNVERKFHGRDTAFGRNQGVVGPESIPKTVQ